MGQGLSESSKLIIAARGYSKEQSQIQADPIFGPYAGSGPLPLEHSKLLAKGQHFEGSVGAAAEGDASRGEECEKQ